MPAWRRRCAAARPEAPAPITAHRKSLSPSTSVVCHEGSRGSLPGSASSSVRNPSQYAAASAPTRKPKMRRRSSDVSRWSGRPEARCPDSAARASARASASAASPRPRPGTSSCVWSGSNGSRSNERSPVRCATAHRSGCTSAAAQAAATLAGSSPPILGTSLRRRVAGRCPSPEGLLSGGLRADPSPGASEASFDQVHTSPQLVGAIVGAGRYWRLGGVPPGTDPPAACRT